MALLSLKLGTIAFGGPAAHIAMLQDEVVRRRHWLTEEEFLDRLGASNLVPGPSSTELVIHVGYRRAGWPGLVVAGICFILPAALMVTALAWAYVRFGTLPAVAGLLYGVKPAVIAIVLHALWDFARTAVKNLWLLLVGLATAALGVAGMNAVSILLAGGLVTGLRQMLKQRWATPVNRSASVSWLPLLKKVMGGGAAAATPVKLWALFGSFVKIGSVVFGSGYVLLAFLRAEFVDHRGWLTTRQLLDAVAVGQVTPGPVFTTATFIGYLIRGPMGACVATIGIFLPAFVFVAVSAVLLPRIRRSAIAGAALDGINVASVAIMAVVTWQLGRAAIIDWITLGLAVASMVALFWWRLNSGWLVLAAALIGMIFGHGAI